VGEIHSTRPRVLIITTGGTIANRSGKPSIGGADLVRDIVPALRQVADVSVAEFCQIGSFGMTPDHWLRLAKMINSVFSDYPDIAGIVVTHGTDSLEETAYFLNLTVKSNRPVVLVGAMRSADEVSADGPANLINAVRVAADSSAIGHGALVVLNEDIVAARDACKSDNRRTHAFGSTGSGNIGTVDPLGVRFYYRSLVPHTRETEFDVAALKTLPRVAVIIDYTGSDPELASNNLSPDLDGLVIRAFAGGRMSIGMRSLIAEIADSGLPTVITSRVQGGRIAERPQYEFPVILAREQRDNKARILLMLGLTQATDVDALQKIFDTY
jgi:L-asparaginase